MVLVCLSGNGTAEREAISDESIAKLTLRAMVTINFDVIKKDLIDFHTD